MIPFAELSRIAATVAARAGDLRDDTHQEIWLKFLHWPPMNKSYAWKAANSARDGLWRKEKAWARLRDVGPEECNWLFRAHGRPTQFKVTLSTEERKKRRLARWRRWYHSDIERARVNVRERVRAFRLRAV